ncbi:hypothetical protein TeGR_g11175 [Tetraparma gracilis]|uniref:gamma-glutamylcyclotransferase n=1 Tax=Tetraparma gracilis TaxID=2962635 RepID=A0ABQ6N7U3_9STRA|nr:hypothetical protein TeGR_g11175 [Tetraparma gracilis]
MSKAVVYILLLFLLLPGSSALPPYFAYGSNLSPFWLSLRTLTPPQAPAPATLPLHSLRINLGAAASVEPSSSAVEGLLYELPAAAWLALCASEGVPLAYRPVRVRVRLGVGGELGGEVEAVTFRSFKGRGSNKTEQWYKDILVKGGRENGLSEAYVRDVLEALET